MSRSMKGPYGVKRVLRHIILRNLWEYYVFEENVDDVEGLMFCLVIGFENEMGEVLMSEIKPHIITQTSDLREVMPAPGWDWV